jgi:microcystin-dependent protein
MCTCENSCNCNGSENIVNIIGKTGATGATGATPTIQAGDTTTLTPGDPAVVTLVSLGSNSYQYNFSIPAGEPGSDGTNGTNGWTPVPAIISDGERRVIQIVDWTGGSGTKPSIVNQFIGATGIVSTAAAAVDIRGAAGAAATGGVPIGASISYCGTTDLNPDPDTGAIYFLEDGRSLLRADYPTLFSRIGTLFGAADSLHFNIPLSTGRIDIMLDASVTALNTVGKTTGSRTSTIGATNLPVSPPWALSDPGHTHTMNNFTNVVRGAGPAGIGPNIGSGFQFSTVSINSATTGITLSSNSGGGQALSVLNPVIVKNKLIRVL